MARASVTTQAIALTGLEPALTAPTADGDIVDCGNTFVYVVNGSAGEVDVTVQTPGTVSGLAISECVVAVPAGDTRFIGPLRKNPFGRPTGDDKGRAYVDYESVTDVTRAVVSL